MIGSGARGVGPGKGQLTALSVEEHRTELNRHVVYWRIPVVLHICMQALDSSPANSEVFSRPTLAIHFKPVEIFDEFAHLLA